MKSSNLDDIESTIKSLFSVCSFCGECSLSCPPHFYGLFNPMGVLRRLQREGIEATIESEPLFNCLTCNRCMVNCPNYDPNRGMDFAHLIRELRHYANLKGLKIAHADELTPRSILLPEFSQHKLLDNVAICSKEPHLRWQDSGPIAFFTGDIALFLENPELKQYNWTEIVSSSIRLLNQVHITPVLANMYGSGHDEFWAGFYSTFRDIALKNMDIYHQAQVKTIICEDAESYYMWKYEYPKLVPEFDFSIYHLSEFLLAESRYEHIIFDVPLATKYIMHDVSRLGRLNGHLYQAPREIIDYITENERIEIDATQDYSYDYKTRYFHNKVTTGESLWNQYFSDLLETKAEYLITTSPRTLVAYSEMQEKLKKKIEIGKLPQIRDWAVFISRFLP